MKTCTKCGGIEFYAKGGCKSCAKARAIAYAAKNPEKVKAGKSDWSKANPEKVKAKNDAYKAENPDKKKASDALWRAANADKIKADSATYYAANSEKSNAYGVAWRVLNPDKKRATDSAYNKANTQKILARKAVYRAANSEKAKSATAAWKAANPMRVKLNLAKWAKANPEARRIQNQNRRAKKIANGGVLSKGLSAKLFKLQKGRCACCSLPLGDDFHLDHITPLSLEGANADGNIQLLRHLCNLQKSAKRPIDFMQERGFLL